MESQAKIKVILFFLILIILINAKCLFAQDNRITVHFNKEIGKVNKQVYGSSFEAYDTAFKNSYGRTYYGTGVWNPKSSKSVPEVIALAKEIGLSVFRFTTGNHYDWKEAIGSERKHFLFGIDEFLKTTEEIGAKAVFTVRYVNSNAQNAADFIEYLNAPAYSLFPWAEERARNGHALPYNVEYFEIGNEIYDPKNKVSPEEYAHKYLEYYEAMKAIDASIKIGAVLRPSHIWNRRVMEVLKDKIDFGIIHIYPTPFPTLLDKRAMEMSYSEILRLTLALPIIKSEVEIQAILKLLREKAGKDIPLAITEFNIGLPQSNPIRYRHTLGAALVNAELLRIFMKPENNILMANYHHFSNGHWGMVKSEDSFTEHDYRKPINYIKQPNYYIYELYNRHFGEILIETDVKSEIYNVERDESYMQRIISNINEGTISGGNLLGDQWKIKKLEGVNADEKNGELEIDFVNPKEYNYFHASKKAEVQPGAYYRLSGYIKTENLIDRVGISLVISDGRGWSRTHSIAETERISGNSNWQYVHVIYKTLKGAKSVDVMARRTGKRGPLKGKVFLKDVKLEQIDPGTRIPYLSVNAAKSKDGSVVYLMVINKSTDKAITTLVDLRNIADNADETPLVVGVWTLGGPSIAATNEIRSDNVKVLHKEIRIEDTPFEYTFQPYSLTAIEIKGYSREE